MTPLSYHSLNLSLIALETMRLLVLIQMLDANKADRYDGIWIRMLKLSNASIMKLSAIIFENCLSADNFTDDWKKGNIVPVHTKNSKQLFNNYRPVSRHLIYSRTFEKLISCIFNFMIQNNFFNSSVSF